MPITDISARRFANPGGGFEPQLQNRFEITIDLGVGLGGAAAFEPLTIATMSSALPTVTLEEIEIPSGNDRVYVPGKATFETVPIVFRDFIDEPVRDVMDDWFEQCYDARTGRIGYASDCKKNGIWTILGPDRSYRRSYILEGIWVQTYNGGTLDVSASELVQIEGTFRYDFAYRDRNFTPSRTNPGTIPNPNSALDQSRRAA